MLRLMEEHAPFNRLLGLKGETPRGRARGDHAPRAGGLRRRPAPAGAPRGRRLRAHRHDRGRRGLGRPRAGRVRLDRGPARRLPRARAARRAAARGGEAPAQGQPRLPRADERDPGRACSWPRAPPSTTSTGGNPSRDPNPPARARARPPARRVHRLRALLHLRGRGHQRADQPPLRHRRPVVPVPPRASTSTWTASGSGRCTSRRAARTSARTCGARSTSTGRTSAAPSTTAPAR